MLIGFGRGKGYKHELALYEAGGGESREALQVREQVYRRNLFDNIAL